MDRDDDTDWTLLARWLAGECSATERAELERWLDADPARRVELAELRRVWERAATLPAPSRVDAMWNRLAARMHPAAGAPSRAAAPLRAARPAPRRPTPVIALLPHRAPLRPRWRVAAASAAAGLLVAAGALSLRERSAATTAAAPEPAPREFATARGQRATIRLVDGTRVELGFASTLRVRPFADGRRELFLEGEAMFDVVHDAARPFLVHAANAVTEDLGTSFAIRAYPGDSSVRVVVMSGRVALRPRERAAAGAAGAPGAPEAVLGPGELGRLDPAGRIEVRSRVDTAEFLGWMSGRVVFDNARLDEVAAELARRFDVAIRIPDPALGARRVTVDMPARSLAETLDAAIVPLGLRSRRDGSTIVLER